MTDVGSSSKIIEYALTEKIIGAAIEVHRVLGPGLLESVYHVCLGQEARLRGLPFLSQVLLAVNYKGMDIEQNYRLDFIFDNKVVVEIKAVDKILPVHEAQLITYLKLSSLRVGLLINFNEPLLKDGILRRVL